MSHIELRQLEIEQQKEINAICNRFENLLQAGEPPEIVELLNEVAPQQREALLTELVKIDAKARRDSGQHVELHDYMARFPNDSYVIAEIFSKELPTSDSSIDKSKSDRSLSVEVRTGTSNSLEPSTVRVLAVPGQYIVGNDPSADIVLPDNGSTRRRHACLILEPGRSFLVDLNPSSDIRVNDQPIEFARLKPDDEIMCGDCLVAIRPKPRIANEALMERASNLGTGTNRQRPGIPEIQGYCIGHLLGRGSFGSVYSATQLGTDLAVAIKVLHPEYSSHERLRSVFMREISIVSQLKHPYIVEYLGFGFSTETPYLLMERLPCEPLTEVVDNVADIRRTRLAKNVVLRMLDALEHAHSKGVVHRDVKLSNLLAYKFKGRLHVKLADFGLSKFFETAGNSGLTASNTVCGTLTYMSPEQLADSKYAKPPCDIYATLVCLYRLLTGEFPHASQTLHDMIEARMSESVIPIQELNPAVPLELALLVERGLDVDPKKRFETAIELAKAIRATEC